MISSSEGGKASETKVDVSGCANLSYSKPRSGDVDGGWRRSGETAYWRMSHRAATVAILAAIGYSGCAGRAVMTPPAPADTTRVDTVEISDVARALSSDAMRGRGTWTPETERDA